MRKTYDLDDMDDYARHRVRFILARITWEQIKAIRNVGGNHPGSKQANADLRWMEKMADHTWAESDEVLDVVTDKVLQEVNRG